MHGLCDEIGNHLLGVSLDSGLLLALMRPALHLRRTGNGEAHKTQQQNIS